TSRDSQSRRAAQTLETEIHRYFDLCNQEASHDDFQTMLRQTIDDKEIQKSLTKIGQSESPREAMLEIQARETLLDSGLRLKLDQYLEERLRLYSASEDQSRRRQRLASLFVCDRNGTILSIAYGKPVAREQNSAGRNFAYRTYFSGLRDDLPDDVPLAEVPPLKATHLSSAFQSTATGLWKVAISTPVRLPGNDRTVGEDGSGSTDAVFGPSRGLQ
ncbi:unnamed protein product, partial [Hapterophycus canaliculatus]